MSYAFTVDLKGGWQNNDKYTFTVAAPNAKEAIEKAIRQAKKDSGAKRWAVVALSRGGWLVT